MTPDEVYNRNLNFIKSLNDLNEKLLSSKKKAEKISIISEIENHIVENQEDWLDINQIYSKSSISPRTPIWFSSLCMIDNAFINTSDIEERVRMLSSLWNRINQLELSFKNRLSSRLLMCAKVFQSQNRDDDTSVTRGIYEQGRRSQTLT